MAFITMYNMILEEGKEAYTTDGAGGKILTVFDPRNSNLFKLCELGYEDIVQRLPRIVTISDYKKSKMKHQELLVTLVEHN